MQEGMEICCIVGWLVSLKTRGLEEKNIIMIWRASINPPTFPHFCHWVFCIVIFVLPVYLICLKSCVFFWIFLVHLFHIVDRLWSKCTLAHFVVALAGTTAFRIETRVLTVALEALQIFISFPGLSSSSALVLISLKFRDFKGKWEAPNKKEEERRAPPHPPKKSGYAI